MVLVYIVWFEMYCMIEVVIDVVYGLRCVISNFLCGWYGDSFWGKLF